jgi:quercetin dioxygenase-like cupin family protein
VTEKRVAAGATLAGLIVIILCFSYLRSHAAEFGLLTLSPKDVMKAALAGKDVVSGKNFRVLFNHRDKPGEVEIHTQDSDVLYVISGEAQFILGGKALNTKETAPHEIRGQSLDGGKEQEIKGGEFFFIPPGTPHWFKTISTPVDYLVVKVR